MNRFFTFLRGNTCGPADVRNRASVDQLLDCLISRGRVYQLASTFTMADGHPNVNLAWYIRKNENPLVNYSERNEGRRISTTLSRAHCSNRESEDGLGTGQHMCWTNGLSIFASPGSRWCRAPNGELLVAAFQRGSGYRNHRPDRPSPLGMGYPPFFLRFCDMRHSPNLYNSQPVERPEDADTPPVRDSSSLANLQALPTA